MKLRSVLGLCLLRVTGGLLPVKGRSGRRAVMVYNECRGPEQRFEAVCHLLAHSGCRNITPAY